VGISFQLNDDFARDLKIVSILDKIPYCQLSPLQRTLIDIKYNKYNSNRFDNLLRNIPDCYIRDLLKKQDRIKNILELVPQD